MLSKDVFLTSRQARIHHLRMMKEVNQPWPYLSLWGNPYSMYNAELYGHYPEFTAREQWWITWGGTALFDRLQAIRDQALTSLATRKPRRR